MDLDSIIESIDNEAQASGVFLVDPVASKPKANELTDEQKKIVVNFILEVGAINITTQHSKQLSEKLGIPVDKAHHYLRNSLRRDRTNGIKTIMIIDDEVFKMNNCQ